MSLLRFALSALLLTACADQTVERTARPAAPAQEEEPAPEEEAPVATPPASTTTPPASTPTPAPPAAASCTSTFGHAITAQSGRLDGVVRAVILPGDAQCKSDNDHVIVQIDADGATYPAWINIESNVATVDPQIRFAELRAPLAFDTWSAGWHPATGQLDYPTTLGVHTSAFTAMSKETIATRIAALVTEGAKVSVFFEGFATSDGGHKVHRNGYGKDGALVVIEKTGQPRWLLFHFAQQSF
jgi:hypothetical protein